MVKRQAPSLSFESHLEEAEHIFYEMFPKTTKDCDLSDKEENKTRDFDDLQPEVEFLPYHTASSRKRMIFYDEDSENDENGDELGNPGLDDDDDASHSDLEVQGMGNHNDMMGYYGYANQADYEEQREEELEEEALLTSSLQSALDLVNSIGSIDPNNSEVKK